MPLPGKLSAYPLQEKGGLRARPYQAEVWEEEGSSCPRAEGPGLPAAHPQEDQESPGPAWGLSTFGLRALSTY